MLCFYFCRALAVSWATRDKRPTSIPKKVKNFFYTLRITQPIRYPRSKGAGSRLSLSIFFLAKAIGSRPIALAEVNFDLLCAAAASNNDLCHLFLLLLFFVFIFTIAPGSLH